MVTRRRAGPSQLGNRKTPWHVASLVRGVASGSGAFRAPRSSAALAAGAGAETTGGQALHCGFLQRADMVMDCGLWWRRRKPRIITRFALDLKKQNTKFFNYLYGILNIVKINHITQIDGKSRDESNEHNYDVIRH